MDRVFLSQFIMGKLVSRVSDYRIVAYTLNYEGHIRELDKISNQYRFDGSHGSRDDRKSVGIILGRNESNLLIRSLTAVDENNYQMINGNSPFIQYHYVEMPSNYLYNEWHVDLILLLFRLWSAPPIPCFSEINISKDKWENTINESIFSDSLSSEEDKYFDSSKIEAYWNDSNSRIIILQQLAIILNKRKLVIAPITDLNILSLSHKVLLLIPTVIRKEIKLALGSIDINSCSWADIIFKTTEQKSSMPNEVIYFNCKNNSFLGNATSDIFQHIYINIFLSCFEKSPENLVSLINHLNSIDKDLVLNDLSDPKKILLFLIPNNISEDLKFNLFYKCISHINIQDWKPLSDELSSPIRSSFDSQIIWQSLVKIWEESPSNEKNFERIYIFIQSLVKNNAINFKEIFNSGLSGNSELDTKLLFPFLTCVKDSINNDIDLSSILERISKNVINKIKDSMESLEVTLQVVNCLSIKEQERFMFIDETILYCNNSVNSYLTIFFPLLPFTDFEVFERSAFCQFLIENNSKWLKILCQLLKWESDCLEKSFKLINEIEKVKLISVSFNTIDIFCANVVSRNRGIISKSSYLTFAEENIKKHMSAIQNGCAFGNVFFVKTFKEIGKILPTLIDLILQLETKQTWSIWHQISSELSSGDNLKQLKFLDDNLSTYYIDEVLSLWIMEINDSTISKEFISSKAFTFINRERMNKAFISLTADGNDNIFILVKIILNKLGDELITDELLHSLDVCWSQKETLTSQDMGIWSKLSNPGLLKKLDRNCLLRIWKISGLFDMKIIFPVELLSQFKQDPEDANVKIISKQLVVMCRHSILLSNILEWSKQFGLKIGNRKEIVVNYADNQIIDAQLLRKLLMESAEYKDNLYEGELISKLKQVSNIESRQAIDITHEYLHYQYNVPLDLLNTLNEINLITKKV